MSTPIASPLKQGQGDMDDQHGGNGKGGGVVAILNGGKAGIESHGNVTVLAGQRGELKCRTFNLANYTVRLYTLTLS